ncbi:uncharacterized protein RHO25_002216 [Cercospora beticola]|uniref:Protein kinase domain-containing protein n=1 Tax=Cercospora beticola TaxID=122368 RepID=A0ABZ0NDI8_CERBT|nr:hypothetical protein RHO25_002216 [Cercospora beticola]
MFKVKHETVNEAKFTILPDSGIFVCQGNYATSSRREDGNFILENKSRENDVQMLCSLLNEDKLQELQGLLPVLGYRQPPYNEPDGTKVFQLIVPLPKDVSWESLEHRIVRSEKPALLQRLDICLKLAKAVESIHTLELKHKSIRPRAVLLLGTPLDGDRAFKLYVQDWSFISKLSGATSLFGETNWQKSIYQHPERQGRYAEHAYDRKHDIYSLGVCILQVLLWQVFVQEATGAPDRICDLFETYALNRSGYSDSTGIPEKYRGNTQKITSKPWATQAIWREIAVGELDDVKLTRLVIRCLESDAAYAFREAKDVVKQLEVLLKQEQDGLNAPSYTTFGA